MWDYSSKWALNSPQLAAGKTKADKEKLRNTSLRKKMMEVSAYIAQVFQVFEDKGDLVICPYHFEVSFCNLPHIQYITLFQL
jgi:hypothetical protein